MLKPAIERRDLVARGVALLAAASVLAGFFALPVAAASGPTRLRDPVVEPRLATPGALVTFAVTYRNREGSPADWVRVEVGEMVHELAPTTAAEDPADWKAGVRFEAVVPAPAVGTYPVVFVSFDSRRFYDRLEAGSLTVASPATPSPSPTANAPSPTPTPTTNPTKPSLGGSGTSGSSDATDGSSGTGGSGSSGGSAPLGPSPTPSSGPAGGSAPVDSGEATPSSAPSSGAGPAPTEPVPSDPAGPGPWPGAGTWDPVPDPGSSGSAVGPDGRNPGSNPDTAGGDDGFAPDPGSVAEVEPAAGDPTAGRAAGPVGGAPATIGAAGRALLDGLGVGPRVPDEVWVASVFVTTAGGAAMAMAFLLFGRRRREDDERTEPPTQAPATVGMPPSSVLVPDPTVPEHERHLPRWRRPSLLEARKTDPLRTERTATNLTFGNAALAPSEGRERRRIRYRLVRLLDAPDEVRANEIGILDQGDEVELIERSGSYWLVLCPDGSRGWLHRMVLGEVVGERSTAARVTAGTAAGAEPGLGPGLLDEILARRPRAGGDCDR